MVTLIYHADDFVFGSSGLRGGGGPSSVAASAASLVSQLLVVVVARVACHRPRAVEAAGLAHELAFVVKAGVTMCAQAKLELGALLVALVFCEVHEGDVDVLLGSSRRTLVILVPCVVVVLACVSKVIPRGVLELLYMLFVGGAFLLVIPAVVVWLFGLATPYPSSGGGGRSGLSSHRRRHRCFFDRVTAFRLSVRISFQFFFIVWDFRMTFYHANSKNFYISTFI